MPNPETFHLDDNIDNLAEEVRAVVDPLYERQEPLGLARPSVILVGAGGVGCWVALALVLGGVEDITIYDGDTLSGNNLNRFPLPPNSIGELKSVALASWLRTLRPKASNINARGMFDPEVSNPMAANWLVCCTDSLKSRKMCYQYVNSRKTEYGATAMKYLEVGADGERWTLSPAPPEFSTELEDNPGYATVPVHVGPCMMGGSAAAYYVLHDITPTVSHLVDWDKGPDYRHGYSRASLAIAKMDEVIPYVSRYPFVICPTCHRQVEGELINTTRHIRQCDHIGLVEAKEIATRLIAMATPVPLTQDEDSQLNRAMEYIGEVEVIPENEDRGNRVVAGAWTEAEANDHDDYVVANPAEFNEVEVNEAAEAIRRRG